MRRLWGFESQLPYEDWSLRLPLNSGANMKMIEAQVRPRPLADDRPLAGLRRSGPDRLKAACLAVLLLLLLLLQVCCCTCSRSCSCCCSCSCSCSRPRFHTDGGACCCRARRCVGRSRTWRRFRCGGRARGSPRPRGCRLTAAR